MKNVWDYANNSNEPFDRREISAGDGLVFSAIAYDEFSNYSLPLPARVVDYGGIPECRPIMHACAASKRFSDVEILCQSTVFTEKPHCQFSGTACRINNVLFVSYRGTDETVSGWLEDFDMIHTPCVPAQKFAVEFLNDVAKKNSGDIYLSGHSKGGSCAVYAAAFCDPSIQDRIKKVYSFDGPGLLPELKCKSAYKEMVPKIEVYVPKMSFFGMFFLGSNTVIPTYCRGFWFLQHDHYAFMINDDGTMASGGKLSFISKKTAVVFHRLLSCLSKKERETFSKIAEDALVYAKVTSMYSMSFDNIIKLLKYLLTLKNKDERKFGRWLLRELLFCVLSPIS